jgi:hypothetical protein
LFFAITWQLADAGDMKLISAVLVVIALVFSQNTALRGVWARFRPARSRGQAEPRLDPALAAAPAESPTPVDPEAR